MGDGRLSYADLWQRILERSETLRRDGPAERVVCLRAQSSPDWLVGYFALHLAGYVAAPLERDTPDELLAAIARELNASPLPPDAADILYTTGTTGRSKGVIVSHRAILANSENLIDAQGFSHDLAFVVNGPLNHIGSLSKLFPVLMLGGTVVLVDGMKDHDAFFRALRYPAAKTATFLVPAAIRMLLQLSRDRLAACADRIDFIETGAAAISSADMQELCRLLPHSRLYNTYASTETGIVATYNFNDGRCRAGCLGRTMRHARLFITPEGHIACSGPMLMSGYAGDPERTASVLRDGVLYTSDLGELDAEGMLHLSGREDDIINVGGYKVSPLEVEDAALASPLVADCLCIPAPHPVTGQALKLLVVPAAGCAFSKRALALFLKERLELYKVPLLYEEVPAIRRTFNGKPDRKAYLTDV
jgi:acyl-CoA synthetase (AMP-forming)/AMP-acid ligase II